MKLKLLGGIKTATGDGGRHRTGLAFSGDGDSDAVPSAGSNLRNNFLLHLLHCLLFFHVACSTDSGQSSNCELNNL